MWTSVIKLFSGLVTLFNRVIPSWEFKAGQASAKVEQAAIKARLDSIYDKIDDKYLSADDAGDLLLRRSRAHYSTGTEVKTGS